MKPFQKKTAILAFAVSIGLSPAVSLAHRRHRMRHPWRGPLNQR